MSKLQPKLISTMKDYNKEQFGKDVIAGIIVAIIALPLSIALAIASGVSPEKGLYTAIIAGFFISLLGGSRVQIGGPTGAFMVIVYGVVMKYGVMGLTIATIMAGIMLIIMGLLKMGSVIKFIPYPITTGFTSGIALVIFSSQIKDFFGLKTGDLPAEFIEKWKVYFESFNSISIQTTLIGLLALLIIIFWPKVTQKVPGALIALLVTSVLVKVLNLDVATIGTKFANLSSDLPKFSLPTLDLEQIKMLIAPAFTIAILGAIESLLSAVVSDGMIGGKHRSNMELVAQGVANMMSGLFGGIPATGAIARTMANIRNGGRTPVAGIVHAITLLLILVIFMPLAKMIPLTSLAAVLIYVAYNMSEWREFKVLFKSPKSDVVVLLVTFFMTVLIDLVKAIEIGMILAAFLFMKRMSDVTSVNTNTFDASEEKDEDETVSLKDLRNPDEKIQLYKINGPFFFGAVDKFLSTLNQLQSHTEVLILDMTAVPSMDATALHALRRMFEISKHNHFDVYMVGINVQPLEALKKSGLNSKIKEEHYFKDLQVAMTYAQNK
ncbi:MAG: sulfate permease [Clostridia bacterium]|nr:sulfate permease [Clostridia bacterium]